VFVGGAQPGDTNAGLEQPLTIVGTEKVDEAAAGPGPASGKIFILRK
jgi:hypothetical protein